MYEFRVILFIDIFHDSQSGAASGTVDDEIACVWKEMRAESERHGEFVEEKEKENLREREVKVEIARTLINSARTLIIK